MKFAVFCYDFPHWKTQNGLFALHINKYKPELVIGAPWFDLGLKPSKTRVVHKNLYLEEPYQICNSFRFRYIRERHDSRHLIDTIKHLDLDFGIILGARILKKPVIESFRYGIINFHPGLLPENRGLDNMKWAIKKGIKQGVTAHFINEKVDSGYIISRTEIPVLYDDSMVGVQFTLQNYEIKVMIETLSNIFNEGIDFIKYDSVAYKPLQKCMTDEEDSSLDFEEYKRRVYAT